MGLFLKILDLPLKYHWYDLIEQGRKTCEYREAREYWTKRLESGGYTHVRFRRGYSGESMLFEIAGISLTGEANDLGLPRVWKISLGQRLGK